MEWIDTHIDTLWDMNKSGREFYQLAESGHVDLPRAREADLLCGFFTGFPSDSHFITEKMVRDWIQFTTDPRSNILRIRNYADVENLQELRKKNPTNKPIGAVMHFEGAAGIDTELNRLYIYYDVGLRSMGMTWNETNQFATGQEGDKSRGLTREGLDLLSAMNDLGILVDVSHLNDKSFWDVANNSTAPIFASHSNVRKLANHNRNLLDDMITTIADSGGSIGVNLYKGFLATKPDDATVDSIYDMYRELISLTNTKSVHSGADLDGATFPEEIKDIRDLANLFPKIQEKLSLTDEDMERISKGNMMRLMKQVWK